MSKTDEMVTCDECQLSRPESEWPKKDDYWPFCEACDRWLYEDGYCYGCTFCPPSYVPSYFVGCGLP